MLTAADIPARFWSVPYACDRIPAPDRNVDLSRGANCQLFAYALLAHFGRFVPPHRSSELWTDTEHTARVAPPYAPLDLLLFAPTDDPYGAHVAVALGPDSAIHLSQRIGTPVIWSLERFHEEADYRHLLGAKRVR